MNRASHTQEKDELVPGQDGARGNAGDSSVLQYTYKTPKLDEIEDALNRFVAPEKLVPVARGQQTDGAFRFLAGTSLGLFNVQFGREIVCELLPEETDDRVAVVMSTNGNGKLDFRGKSYDISQKSGVLLTSGNSRVLHFGENTANQVLLSEQSKLLEVCGKLLGHEVVKPVKFDVSFNLESEAGQSWMNLFRFASSELESQHSLSRFSRAARKQIEDMVLTGLLLGHTNNYSDALLRPQPAVAPFYVKRAEAFIEAHFADPLSLADIAAHAGVSARSLQNGFQQFRGMTPMAFLRSTRLQQVHEALTLADPSKATVTEIALACGFSHMGEFGTLYKRTYGVTPRESLRKAAG
ncbi:helix-turn-helix domain-containing protein [Microvirga rosea]|uniref:helix-turn-helix domain-containing protein n=1 Tax=Microvirga rosea TaxID=2715425 RepID=UPI001D09F268|nr:AraC family transcriptional regulator [Microvirga rosea]MCB8822463.1 AraC family transcriptional regulator [Microvirga rosea]